MRNPLKNIFLLRFVSRKRTAKWIRIFENAGWTWTRGTVVAGLSLAIVLLTADIYISVNQAIKNYKSLAIEEAKLLETKAVGEELDRELEYYASLEYKQRYGYDSLNRARDGETLYTVDTDDRKEYELEAENPDPIRDNDAQIWWELVFKMIRAGLV